MNRIWFLAVVFVVVGAAWMLPALLGQNSPPAEPQRLPAPIPDLVHPRISPETDRPTWQIVQRPIVDETRIPGTQSAPQSRGLPTVDPNRMRDFVIKTLDKIGEAQIAVEEGGVLMELKVHRGSVVKAGEILGKIDDTQPTLQRKAALAEAKAAYEKSRSTIDERFGKKSSEVAREEYLKAVESNKRAPNSVSDVEVSRLYLTYEKGLLETERAQEERKLSGLTAEAKQVEVEAGDNAIRKRQIFAPFDGRIEEIKGKIGEWIKPGDPILKIMSIDELQLEGYVSRNQFLPEDLRDKTVRVEVPLGRDRVFKTTAKIVFIQDEVAPGGEYLIVAEMQNTRDPRSNDWILKPGLLADLILEKQ